jgi:hypothetical protein
VSAARAIAAAVAALALAAAPAGATGTGAISGTVVDTTGAVCVSLLDATGQAVAVTSTDSSGHYVVAGVPAGSWVVEFLPDRGCLADETGEARQYYAGRGTPGTADRVVVTAGETTPGVDVTLQAAARITGAVTDRLGAPLAGICVVLEDPEGAPVLRRLTGDLGDYALDQLPAGRFLVRFVDDGCVGAAPRYAPQLRDGAIELAPGRTVPGLDAALDPAPPAGPGAPPGAPGTVAPGEANRPVTGAGVAEPSPPPAARRGAHVELLAASGGRDRVDRARRLALRLRCAQGGPACAITVRVATAAHHPALLGSRSATLRPDGRARTVHVRLARRPRGHRLRVWILLRGLRAPAVTTTVAVSA